MTESMIFKKESDFEQALIDLLRTRCGWQGAPALNLPSVLNYPSEEDLIKNWAEILFKNNCSIDRLNDYH